MQKVNIGDKFGHLTVIKDLGMITKEGTKTKVHYYKCICDCEDHNEIIVSHTNLVSGHTTTCGRSCQLNLNLNNYYIVGDIVYVQYNNSYDCFIIDIDDLEKIKNITWKKHERGYPYHIDKKQYIRLNRFLMNCPDDMVVDHINHKIWDNRKENLRICSISENSKNKKRCSNNKSGFKGIYFDYNRGKWVACIYYDKKAERKRFDAFLQAYTWYYNKQIKHHKNYMYNVLEDERLKLKYAGIERFDVENGKGIGYTLFVQGCSNHCHGCHNPQTWDFNGGLDYTQSIFDEMINFFNKFPQVKRLTLSGGDPLQNLELVNFVAAEFKRLFPERSLWIYTGLLYEDVKDDIKYKALLELTDVLVDGRFIEKEKDLTLAFKGSRNQRVIDVQKSLKQDKVVLLDEQ